MKKLLRVGPYANFFSQGVQVDNVLTLAGQIGVDSDGNIPESIKDQMAVCYSNIKEVLHHYDATLDNIIDETWFVTDVNECMENVEDIFAEREKKGFSNSLGFLGQTMSIKFLLIDIDLL